MTDEEKLKLYEEIVRCRRALSDSRLLQKPSHHGTPGFLRQSIRRYVYLMTMYICVVYRYMCTYLVLCTYVLFRGTYLLCTYVLFICTYVLLLCTHVLFIGSYVLCAHVLSIGTCVLFLCTYVLFICTVKLLFNCDVWNKGKITA